MTKAQLKKIIASQDMIDTYFQPIFSAQKPTIMGYEALLRVKDETGAFLNPTKLFCDAKDYGLSIELDRIARESALRKFSLLDQNEQILLFLNFESSTIDEQVVGSGKILETVEAYGINPARVVIEIKEDKVHNTDELRRFCEFYKQQGFIIALDDVGSASSNLSRFEVVHPHIVKIDKSLIEGIDKNYYASQIVRSITELCHSTGALALAEGVETAEEVIEAMSLGVDLLQGFHLARPCQGLCHSEEFAPKLSHLGHTKRTYDTLTSGQRRDLFTILDTKAQKIIQQMLQGTLFIDIATSLIQKSMTLESLYLLDYNGKLLNETITKHMVTTPLFRPGVEGDDFSLCDYYYMTLGSIDGRFLSQRYISKASGNICRTFACKFQMQDKEIILCLDTTLNSESRF